MNASFDPVFFERLFNIEDRHFWCRTRNHIVAALVRQITTTLAPGYRVLEVGCGTGNVLRVFERACPQGRVVGMDVFAEPLRYARRRVSCSLVQGNVDRLPFRPGFDLIGIFDVLEHLPNDTETLHTLRDLLTPRGRLLLTVAAGKSLWSYYDEAMLHHRRYDLTGLHAALTQAGYAVEYLTYFMTSTFPLVWLGRRLAPLLDRRRTSASARAHCLAVHELRVIFWVNALLQLLLAPEAHLVTRRCRLPVGSSLLAICRRT